MMMFFARTRREPENNNNNPFCKNIDFPNNFPRVMNTFQVILLIDCLG